jgi:SAM-dependent methyltransferase
VRRRLLVRSPAPVALAIVPMQTIHLFADREAFLRCARRALAPGGLLAVALLGEGIEPFELELEPDAVQIDAGALREHPNGAAARRRRGAARTPPLTHRGGRLAHGRDRSDSPCGL